VRQITGGITVPAVVEYLRLRDLLSTVTLGTGEDKLIWRWTADGLYSSKSAYRALLAASSSVYGYPLIWGTWAPLCVKIFLWLAIRRRHCTADRRRRHGLEAADRCYLCDQEPETIDHIIASCSFSRQIWWPSWPLLVPMRRRSEPITGWHGGRAGGTDDREKSGKELTLYSSW
jgi:hypothetical protein